MSDEKRKFRRETRLLQSQSSWLQKAVFAFRKVDDVQDRLADLHDRDPEPYTIEVDGKELPLEAVEDALDERATQLQKTIRERRNRV